MCVCMCVCVYVYVCDLKIIAQFLLLLMGMNAAHAGYACLWCTVHKDKRYSYNKIIAVTGNISF